MRARFVYGIRLQLGLAALALLTIPWLAAQFIVSMETFLRGQQEAAIGATARAIASALSDRPALFSRAPFGVRRSCVAPFCACHARRRALRRPRADVGASG